MLLELHTHTSKHSSCSRIDPVTLVRQVKARQLQGVIITEHHYLWTIEELEDLRRSAEMDRGFLILAGQEVEAETGHVLVYGAPETIKPARGGWNLQNLRASYPETALVWAHPFRKGRTPSADELLDAAFDAVEIFNTNQDLKENYYGLSQWHLHKFMAVAGSDTHAEGMAGLYPTLFDHPVRTIEDVVQEIKHRRCRPFFKEIPKSGSNLTVTEITMGTKGDDETRNRLIVKQYNDEKQWNKARGSVDLGTSLYASTFGGATFRVPRVLAINDAEHLAIEEGQRGRSLYDLITYVKPTIGRDYVALAARWLARLHNDRPATDGIAVTMNRELKRFDSYLRSFNESRNPYLREAERLVGFVRSGEERIARRQPGAFVLNHGDYHPKNIIIGQDRMQDISTLFISVIDFDSALVFSRAFDVGYFLTQFESQLGRLPGMADAYPAADFLNAYKKTAGDLPVSFDDEVALFRIRASLSIASFFIKMGKGVSAEMDGMMARAGELMLQL